MRRILDGMTLEILVDRQREIDHKRAAEASTEPIETPAQVSA
jgi:hypothetical protein